MSSHRSKSVERIVSTGYARNAWISPTSPYRDHRHGPAHTFSTLGRTVVDVGGQDSKALIIDATGKVTDFVMNDKCAAGTGRFLEVMARALEVNLDEFGELSLQSGNPAKISSICTVFAESEVISLISTGEQRRTHRRITNPWARVYAMAQA